MFKGKIGILSVLISLILLVIIINQRKSGLDRDFSNLAFQGAVNINNIKITRGNNTITLQLSDKGWVTSSQTSASTKKIQELITVLHELQYQSSASKKLENELHTVFESDGIEVNLLKNNRLEYRLQFVEYKEKIIVKTRDGRFVFATIRGNSNALLGNWVKTDEKQWYDQLLINMKKSDISSALIEYTHNHNRSFKLNNTSEGPEVINAMNEKITSLDSDAANDYLHFFTGIQYDHLDTTLQKPDTYLFRLVLTGKNEQVIEINGFELLDFPDEKISLSHFAGIVNNSLLVKLAYKDFDPVLVDLEYFQKK